MKILQVIPSANPAGGGPIEAIKQAGRVLIPRGHTTDIACLDPPAAPWLKDVELKTFACGPGKLGGYRYTSRFVPWLRDHASDYDCVIVHGVWTYASYGTWRALRSARTPYFLYTHGMLDPTLRRKFPAKHVKKAIYWPLGEYRVLRDARAVFFTCEEERTLASNSFRPARWTGSVVPYCVGPPPETEEAQKETFFARYPELRDKRLLLFLSRIHPKKGCDLLIDAFGKLADRDRDVHLVMAGPDTEGWQADLMTQAQRLGVGERITWTGMITGDLKWSAFRAAEAFVLPTHQENFGIAIVEALACGTPALITNGSNIWREIAEDRGGIVGEIGAEGAVQLLDTWLSMPESDRREMRTLAKQCFERHFQAEQAGTRLIETLHYHGVDGALMPQERAHLASLRASVPSGNGSATATAPEHERGEAGATRFPISAIILTQNEATNIRACLDRLDWVDDLVIVDSGSTDNTLDVARQTRPDVRIFDRAFDSFGDQRNWATQNTSPRHEWVVFFDADERCTPRCADAVIEAVRNPGDRVGYYLTCRNFFLDRWIKHCTLYPSWQLRLFKVGRVQYRKEGHGQRELADGPLGYVHEPYDHLGFSKGITDWIARHNVYSSNEVELIDRLRQEPLQLHDLLRRDPVLRRRGLKRLAARIPFRPAVRFFYMYVIRGGFLDGRSGLLFCLLRVAHEIHITAKLEETRKERRATRGEQ